MAPGHRWDILDIFFGDWNWHKYLRLAKTLAELLEEALIERPIHLLVFKDITATIDAAELKVWMDMVEAWECDPVNLKLTNPYVIAGEELTMAQIRKQLADEEERTQNKELHDVDEEDEDECEVSTMVDFLAGGIALEQTMIRLQHDIEDDPPRTAKQEERIKQRRQGITRALTRWRSMQAHYMSTIHVHLVSKPSNGSDLCVEKITLYMPSDVPLDKRSGCSATLLDYEWQLRRAAAFESLREVQRYLCLASHLFGHQYRRKEGQREGTRSDRLKKSNQGRTVLIIGSLSTMDYSFIFFLSFSL
ncbi:hypothetical protein M422DRAFT_262126 [Sphaerobolus stellatus SS14]|uniref:Uncharacterized protein n=1 Tax=Sphaerobolus stellatus (strain SS14) TaxID=990650 RepID=A0A0C9UKY9_SPHS4|nr:hypothetical protein M422DRAFT_262126 [Sphaerobolus stellatus SS14]